MAALSLSLSLLVSIPHLINPLLVSPPIIRGTIARGTTSGHDVYTTGAGEHADALRTFGGGQLRLIRQDIRGEAKAAILYCGTGFGGNSSALLRWQLIDDHYYCVNYWTQDPVHRAGYVRVVPLAAIKLVNAILDEGDSYDRRWDFQTLVNQGPHFSTVGRTVAFKEDPIKKSIFFDFWCRGEKQYEVYVTEPHKGNRLTRGDFHPEWKKQHDYEKWDTVGEWTFDWTGPFYVAPSGEERYFVTDSGHVFLAPRGAKAGAPLKEVWKGPRVEALIHDSDSKKFYAFTKDQYFELSEPIKPKPHSVAIRREWSADKALESAAKCARVIRDLPEPKGK